MRSALGASRGRIVAQLFAESFVLSSAARGRGTARREDRARLGALEHGAARPVDVLDRLHAVGNRARLLRRAHRARRGDHGRHPRAACDRPSRELESASIQQRRPDCAWAARGRRSSSCRWAVASAALPIAVALGWFQVRDIFSVPTFPVEQILFAEVTVDREPSAEKTREHRTARQRASPGCSRSCPRGSTPNPA